MLGRGLREAIFLAYAAVGLFVLVALITFNPNDAGWSHSEYGRKLANGGGALGALISDFSLTQLGLIAWLLPFLLAGYGYTVSRGNGGMPRSFAGHVVQWLGMASALSAGAGLATLKLSKVAVKLPEGSGGIMGEAVADLLTGNFGRTGAFAFLVAAFLSGVSLYTGLSWISVIDIAGKSALYVINAVLSLFAPASKRSSAPVETQEQAEVHAPVHAPRPAPEIKPKPAPVEQRRPAEPRPVVSKPAASAFLQPPTHSGELPPLDLLNDQAPETQGYSDEALEDMSRLVESILADFGVSVTVAEIHPGPVITRFEIQPAAGIKVSRITGLAKDLARALSVTSVRVVEIIPGKSLIGLEIPNEEREMVLLHSVLASDVYQHAESPLTLVLGKSISGEPVVANLAKMPHLLVAGTTGSGKSVAINVMILSMLYKATPEEVRLIMIDPKMLELSIYADIPHLLTPVVTDMKEAANSLRWCVAEMERRYALMSKLGVRNLAGYNEKVKAAIKNGAPLLDPTWKPNLSVTEDGPPELAPLPFIVIVIDELADMMMIVGKKVEELIARLAQKARAAGLHLILATQRPSVDVLTGLIKANIPTRLSFQVSSRIDSRTVIDQSGAEALLGNGDMLFLPPGAGIPMRAHGAFVSDQEVHDIVEFLKTTGHADYIEEITRFTEDGSEGGGSSRGGNGDGGDDLDALYDEAVRFVTESRKASISGVQRRFKVGYNRAARMIEEMESAGIVGPAETNGSREVLAPPPPEV
ncbi:cell division protein FtsK [Candidatus Methylospira mobilis]|uniref:DNA translocase FtsK n=1 Tax=Candidatus Methylospira mobilis TaxID=1808979 RepID=A0A5Q0BPW0_9GAMM|nr:DNA translocase FtsK [Candidatus Methylospira mobilis]QFY45232.1 cell division protein FtsK [Candidatus Methylospira mobilis]